MKNSIKIIISVGVLVLVFILFRFSSGMSLPYTGINIEKKIHLVFVGDVMLSRQIGKIIEANGPTYPFTLIKQYIEEADIAFANLENPVSVRGFNQGSIYSFRAKPDTLKGLKFAGFDIVSIANNHMFDWGMEAFVDTIEHLSAESIKFVGGAKRIEETRVPVIFQESGERICYLAYTQFAPRNTPQGNPGMAFLDTQSVISDINSSNAQGCSTTIISLHWGNEYETKYSQEQKEIARKLVQAGADIVIGHHPHVLQEIEEYEGGLIAYSLGNFIFDQNFSEDTKKSQILNVYIENGKVVSFNTIPIGFTENFQPEVISAL